MTPDQPVSIHCKLPGPLRRGQTSGEGQAQEAWHRFFANLERELLAFERQLRIGRAEVAFAVTDRLFADDPALLSKLAISSSSQ
jgi:hypothetical protein